MRPTDSHGGVTRLLHNLESQDPAAADDLLRVVYDELRRVAGRHLADIPRAATLQPTSLVHEAYIRLMSDGETRWRNRDHFFGVASKAMRGIVVEHARRRASLKRGGDRDRVNLDDGALRIEMQAEDLLALDEALSRLEQEDASSAQLVQLRFFGGLTGDQAAAAMGISTSAGDRLWAYAKAKLNRELSR